MEAGATCSLALALDLGGLRELDFCLSGLRRLEASNEAEFI